MADAGESEWVTLPAHVAPALEFDALPFGIVINNGEFVDQRGNRYRFFAETVSSPARIGLAAAGSGGTGGAGGGGGGGGAGGGGGGGAGAAAVHPLVALALLAPWAFRPKRAGCKDRACSARR